jgi:hypothetical protein
LDLIPSPDSEVAMRRSFLVVLALLLVGACLPAAEPEASTKVTGTVTVPKAVPAIAKQTLELRLYEYDPRLADAPATLIEKVEVPDFTHKAEADTVQKFTIGEKGQLKPMKKYYLTVFVLDGKTRTHIGRLDHLTDDFGKVLTDGNPREVKATLRPVKK